MDELFPTRCMVSPMKLKSQGYEQVTVILAVNIIYSNKFYVHEKENTFSKLEKYSVLRYSFIKSQLICVN